MRHVHITYSSKTANVLATGLQEISSDFVNFSVASIVPSSSFTVTVGRRPVNGNRISNSDQKRVLIRERGLIEIENTWTYSCAVLLEERSNRHLANFRRNSCKLCQRTNTKQAWKLRNRFKTSSKLQRGIRVGLFEDKTINSNLLYNHLIKCGVKYPLSLCELDTIRNELRDTIILIIELPFFRRCINFHA